MREMIISELSQALLDLRMGFAHYLPRLIVMLILAFVGWAIAYAVKVVLRSILRLISRQAVGKRWASQLLNKPPCPQLSEVLSRFGLLGGMAWLYIGSGWVCSASLACRSRLRNSFSSCRGYS